MLRYARLRYARLRYAPLIFSPEKIDASLRSADFVLPKKLKSFF